MLPDNCITGSENVPPTATRTLRDQKLATGLIEEYEQTLYAGKNPSSMDYLERYQGADRDSLKVELNLVTFFWNHRNEVSRALDKLEREETRHNGEMKARNRPKTKDQ